MPLLLMISSMPPWTGWPCTVTDPRSATASGLGVVCCCIVPDSVVLAVPVVFTVTSAAYEDAVFAWAAACLTASAAVSEAPPFPLAVAGGAAALLLPELVVLFADEAEQPATTSAPAVSAMAPHRAVRVPRCCGIMPNLQAGLLCGRPIPGSSVSNNLTRIGPFGRAARAGQGR